MQSWKAHTFSGNVTFVVIFSRVVPVYLKRLMWSSSTLGRR